MLLIFPPFVITVVDDDDLSRRIETRKATTRDERQQLLYKLFDQKGFLDILVFTYFIVLCFCNWSVGNIT